MPQYTRASLRTRIGYKTKGSVPTTTIDGILNEAVREVTSDIDLYSMKRRVLLSLDGANAVPNEAVQGTYTSAERTKIKIEMDKYNFHAPHDLKGNAITDIQRRTEKVDEWEMYSPEEFQRRKTMYSRMMAVENHSFLRKILASGIEDITKATIHSCDTYDGNGTWAADTTQVLSVFTITSNYVEGIGAVGFTTVSGTMTGGTLTLPSGMTAIDLAAIEDHSLYMWVYIPFATGLTSIALKWGSSSSAYWSRTVNKQHDNCAFHVGWNLLRFPWADATETGSPDVTAVDYLQVTIIKGSTNTAETGWMIDGITAHKDSLHDVIYYSEYGWQDANGVYLQEASTDTDTVNANNEEVDLILTKAAELVSEFIDDQDGVKRFNAQYRENKFDYGLRYPSEAKLLTTIYQGLASTDTISNFNSRLYN